MEKVGSNGELNNDRMIQALLRQRTTPESGCKLSPAQILLGRNLKKSLPYVRKSVMTYNNPQILICGVTYEVKRKNLSVFVILSLEHTKMLPLLNCGDHVVIQNQTGNFPKNWGKSGKVVELNDYHQTNMLSRLMDQVA